MRKLSIFSATVPFLLAASVASHARADQKLRVQVDQRGDFVLIGNTLGWDCGASAPAPVVGDVPTTDLNNPLACGLNAIDSSSDVFWRADDPTDGKALASVDVTAADARSTAVLALPKDAEVTHAFLYWAARRTGAGADTDVVLDRPGGFLQAVKADDSHTLDVSGDTVYQSVADVTATVIANGDGPYRVSGVDARSFPDASEDVLFAGWSMVVLYRLDTDNPRNLAIFDGFDSIDANTPSSVSLNGFLVPMAGFDAKLGVVTYEGDDVFNGDSLRFGKAPLGDADRLSDALNPVDNFFNGTRSLLGQPVSVVGDLPQLTGQASSMSGMDLDVVDITSRVKGGQTSADLQASSSLDVYYVGVFITSISTFRPDFITSQKSVKDVNGGVVDPGDELEYTVVVENTGNDASIKTMVTDPLPMHVSFVPGSIEITSGDNKGKLTDKSGDDEAEYDAAANAITVRLGKGADATNGGSIAVASASKFVFRVKVDKDTTTGIISNQASIAAAGERGAPVSTTLTDGNADGPGSPTTDIPVGACDKDAMCPASAPHCDLSMEPHVCVQCTADADCPGSKAMCDPKTRTCGCAGPTRSCADADGDGVSDDEETMIGTNPLDADSDDDGVSDGQEPDRAKDSDGDGLINALDPDSDDDGLFDGTELGFDCSGKDTDVKLGHCRPDGDKGATVTDPLNRDTDGGGASDGSEDSNLNGVRDPGERNPVKGQGADDSGVVDSDGDGLSDALEETLGSDPHDKDSDDDGLLDGEEHNPADDTDGDGLRNILDVDSDDDGLYDGTESGKDCSNPDTKPGHCKVDGDAGATVTSPVARDTDRGGASDGSEDANHNGVLDSGETNPVAGHPEDDTKVIDSDGDGISDAGEKAFGSDPHDRDSDDDGVPDGRESNPGDDTDGDGKPNIIDPDSDGDGLKDGTELGFDCSGDDTNAAAGNCTPDADHGMTKTSMVKADTDNGGVVDGEEDANHDGKVDPGERDPNLMSDDNPVVDAGMPDAGKPPPPVDAGPPPSRIHELAGGGCGVSAHGARGTTTTLVFSALVLLALINRRKRR